MLVRSSWVSRRCTVPCADCTVDRAARTKRLNSWEGENRPRPPSRSAGEGPAGVLPQDLLELLLRDAEAPAPLGRPGQDEGVAGAAVGHVVRPPADVLGEEDVTGQAGPEHVEDQPQHALV